MSQAWLQFANGQKAESYVIGLAWLFLIMFGKDSMSTDDQTYIGNFLNSRNASTTTIPNLSLSRICQEVSYYTTLVTKLTLS